MVLDYARKKCQEDFVDFFFYKLKKTRAKLNVMKQCGKQFHKKSIKVGWTVYMHIFSCINSQKFCSQL